MSRVFLIAIAALALVLALAVWRPWSGRDAGEVVVYTSVDDVFARPIAEAFQKETGVAVRLVPDTEEAKSTGLLNRLIAEKNRPQADVFWSGDPVRAEILKKQGVATPYKSPQADGLPAAFSDPQGYWTGFSARARVLIYNKDRVAAGDAPRSVMDLVNPRFQGRACLANPLFGTTSMHAAALFAVLGEEGAKRFFNEFLANGGQLASSNGDVRRLVAEGRCAIGVTDTDDANVALMEGKPIEIVYPDADGMGTLVIPNAAVLIAGGPNPENGERFIDYLLRPATEEALATSAAAQFPLRAGVAVPEEMITLDQMRPMEVDYTALAGRLEELNRGFLKDFADRAR
ncbi:extracellular solute-binding protein [Hyphococcus luteus]|uniref:Iron ABC transporter substrate-binding protein n=1 Tax=Hyphococcus luteus TaxID=2058213 RepID=A0A2S7K071_9PROT|nr:extracellular solute-binding protein [Marinicaulis flavus]PQA85861.1 iron ABC transporter substrate-binding protein [Marinicaulis flavus]